MLFTPGSLFGLTFSQVCHMGYYCTSENLTYLTPPEICASFLSPGALSPISNIQHDRHHMTRDLALDVFTVLQM